VQQRFYQPIEARIIRISPLTWHNGIAVKMEVLGCQDHIISVMTTTTTEQSIIKTTMSEKIMRPVCEDSMGLNNGLMTIEQISVSSSPQLIQNLSLSSEGVWRAALDNPHQYIQFDFLETRNLTGIITKGGDNAWTTVYKVLYSNDGRHWNPVVDENGNEKEFLGNFDAESQQTNFFEKPLHARLLRVQPIKWHDHVALKIEILGCYLAYPSMETSEITSTTTSSSFERECNICDGMDRTMLNDEKRCKCEDPYWWDGESCVSKWECPCIIGHVSYAVGSVYETEDCQQCTCVLGGTPTCSPKKCEPCLEPGLQSIVSKLCTCLCKPCPTGTRHCPTSDVCVNETSWCDGVQDCPDDEKGCSEIISTTPIAVEISEITNTTGLQIMTTSIPIQIPLPCEEPFCSLGYRVVFKQSRLHHHKTNVKSKNRKGFMKTKGHKKYMFHEHPMKNQDYQPAVEDIQCPEFICVPTKPPVLPGNKKPQTCPETACPPQYEVVYERTSMYKKHKCPKYICRPLKPQEAVCNVIGRTFNTFDNMEYKYDICNHILARDMYGNEWYITLEKLCLDSHGQQRCTRILVVTLNERTIVLYPNLQVDIDGYTFTAEQIARFGNRFPGFELSRTGDRIIFLSHHYGFWVIWDSSTNVKIGVVAKLVGRVDGLCGYFDGNVANDRQTPEGTQARSIIQFGNSWAMEGAKECDLHVCPHDVQEQAWTICNSVKSPMLLGACSAIIDLDRLIDFINNITIRICYYTSL